MIHTKFENKIMELRISRPEKRNALSRAMYGQLASALDDMQHNEQCHAIVICGEGGNFTVGADIGDFQEKRGEGDSPAVTFLRKLAGTEIPVIAAVEGFAVGIGTTLLLHCDFAYAGKGSRFRLPFVGLGLCPEGASSYLLERSVGPKRARDWLMSGRFFDRDEALAAGLLTAVADQGQALDRARATAQQLSQLSAVSLRTTKRMLSRDAKACVQNALDDEVRNFAQLINSEATQQIFRSFLDKSGKR